MITARDLINMQFMVYSVYRRYTVFVDQKNNTVELNNYRNKEIVIVNGSAFKITTIEELKEKLL